MVSPLFNASRRDSVQLGEKLTATTNDVDELVASEHIKSALLRFCRGSDRQDWALLRSAYHPDATDDHGPFKGSLDDFVAWDIERHRNIEHSMHCLFNVSIEQRADVARVESYGLVLQRFKPESTEFGAARPGYRKELHAQCRYLDRFERRGVAGWRIARRTVVLGLTHVVEVPAPRDEAGLVWQQHSLSDPAYGDAVWGPWI